MPTDQRSCADRLLVSIATLLLAVTFGCHKPATHSSTAEATGNGGSEPTEITLALNWFPDAQHGGFYAADVNGHFAAAGLMAEITPGGPAAPVLQNVALGRVDFGVANADQVLMARAQGMPIVAVFAAMQSSPRCILVHREAGIESLEKLHDVTLALGAGKAFAEYLQKSYTWENVTVVPYTGSITPFLADDHYAQQGYVFSEPFFARQQGVDPIVLMVSDAGFNPYTSCIVVNEDLIRSSPERVRKFVRAVQQGWADYLDSPGDVNQRIHDANPQADLASLQFGVEALRPLCSPNNLPTTELGTMSRERWQQLNEQLSQLGLLGSEVATDEAFTNEFVEEPGASDLVLETSN